MAANKGPTKEKRIANIIAGLSIVLSVVGVVLTIYLNLPNERDAWLTGVNALLGSIVYSVLAVLIISRHPRHMIGWLFLIVGFSLALVNFMNGLFSLVEISPTSLPVTYLIDLLSSIAWMPAFFIPITLVLLFYPNGRLPSKQWRPIALAAVVGLLGQIVSIIFRPWPFEAQDIISSYNPLAITGSERFFDLVNELSGAILAIALIGSLTALVVRFYKSRGIERLQMKWLVYTVGVGLSIVLLLSPFPGTQESILPIIFLLMPIVIAIIIGMAILRYRLFDIDVIIRRTLQYAIVTGILVLIYFGLVIMLQALFSTVGDQESPIFIVISTLVIAGLFNPLRKRIQNIIDRRFYRKKYHAEQALAQFSAAARDEVDLDRLSAALVEVVQETMQPSSVGLMLISKKK